MIALFQPTDFIQISTLLLVLHYVYLHWVLYNSITYVDFVSTNRMKNMNSSIPTRIPLLPCPSPPINLTLVTIDLFSISKISYEVKNIVYNLLDSLF